MRKQAYSRLASRQTGVDNTSSQKTRAERKQIDYYAST